MLGEDFDTEIKFSMEAETMAADDVTKGEHIDGEEKRSKHRSSSSVEESGE